MSKSSENIGVIGLGLMGSAIASLLIRAGFAVIGYDISENRINSLEPKGLKRSKSPRDTAEQSDIIILSLPNWNAVEEVVEGNNGVVAAAKKGLIVIDSSTSPPLDSRKMAEKLEHFAIEWMDIPISGSSAQAKTGNMVFMAGGKKENFMKVKPILDRIGKKTIYVGSNGNGAMLKLIVNHTLMLNEAAAIEGLVLGMKAGLPPDVMLDALSSGAASSDLIVSRGKDMIAGNFAPKGQLAIGVKDMGLSLEFAKQLGVALPVGALYHQLLLSAHYRGLDDQDATVIMRYYEEMADMRQTKDGR